MLSFVDFASIRGGIENCVDPATSKMVALKASQHQPKECLQSRELDQTKHEVQKRIETKWALELFEVQLTQVVCN